jgi:hypothetical protein
VVEEEVDMNDVMGVIKIIVRLPEVEVEEDIERVEVIPIIETATAILSVLVMTTSILLHVVSRSGLLPPMTAEKGLGSLRHVESDPSVDMTKFTLLPQLTAAERTVVLALMLVDMMLLQVTTEVGPPLLLTGTASVVIHIISSTLLMPSCPQRG